MPQVTKAVGGVAEIATQAFLESGPVPFPSLYVTAAHLCPPA